MTTIPYPEDGIRLIRRETIELFEAQMALFAAALDEAVDQLETRYATLREDARERLGQLFNASDYPSTLIGQFAIAWEYPSVEPPDYLKQLNPALYEQEQARIQARFQEAVQMAEQAFAAEMAGLVAHLAERLSGDQDGKPKVFRESAVTNMRDFFERFERLSVGSDGELNQLVAQAKQIVEGVDPKVLRKDGGLRANMASSLSEVQAELDKLVVNKPTRAISLEDDE